MLRIATRKLLVPHVTANCAKAGFAGVCETDKIAVVLSGCGVYDGTEIHEAAHLLSHLTRNNVLPIMFAPFVPQMHVINHVTGAEVEGQKRNVIEESARIARGDIHPLSKLITTQDLFKAVIFPGGFGVAKNLSDFATKGTNCTVNPEVVSVLQTFHTFKKPIGLMCIAPILAARVLCNVTITLGKDSCEGWPHREAIQAAKNMGATVESMDVNETSYDRENEIYSTPAYMYSGKFHEIDDGIGNFVKFMLVNMRKGEKK